MKDLDPMWTARMYNHSNAEMHSDQKKVWVSLSEKWFILIADAYFIPKSPRREFRTTTKNRFQLGCKLINEIECKSHQKNFVILFKILFCTCSTYRVHVKGSYRPYHLTILHNDQFRFACGSFVRNIKTGGRALAYTVQEIALSWEI